MKRVIKELFIAGLCIAYGIIFFYIFENLIGHKPDLPSTIFGWLLMNSFTKFREFSLYITDGKKY